MTFSDKLKNNNLDLWNKTHVNHLFISGIREGTLEFDKFKHYMIQDYKFLIEYCRVISIAISKSFIHENIFKSNPNQYLEKIIEFTHYNPDKWKQLNIISINKVF